MFSSKFHKSKTLIIRVREERVKVQMSCGRHFQKQGAPQLKAPNPHSGEAGRGCREEDGRRRSERMSGCVRDPAGS